MGPRAYDTVSHALYNFRNISFWAAELNAALCLLTREQGNNSIPQIEIKKHIAFTVRDSNVMSVELADHCPADQKKTIVLNIFTIVLLISHFFNKNTHSERKGLFGKSKHELLITGKKHCF